MSKSFRISFARKQQKQDYNTTAMTINFKSKLKLNVHLALEYLMMIISSCCKKKLKAKGAWMLMGSRIRDLRFTNDFCVPVCIYLFYCKHYMHAESASADKYSSCNTIVVWWVNALTFTLIWSLMVDTSAKLLKFKFLLPLT